jgi:hypothetical protein
VGKIKRTTDSNNEKTWSLTTLGYYTNKTYNVKQMKTIITEVMKNNIDPQRIKIVER